MASSTSCLWPSVGRRDLIGRRFFAIRCNSQRSIDVRRGLIRASTHAECSASEAKVLVEYDDAFHCNAREWVSIYSEFDAFLVEDTLVGIEEGSLSEGNHKLALEFMIIMDKRNRPNLLRHVEYLSPDRAVRYIPISRIVHLKEEDYVELIDGQMDDACRTTFAQWIQFQQSQQILINYPLCAVGHLVKVYDTGGSDQWYTGRITGFNEISKIFTVMDERGFEHNENCMLVQMELSSKVEAVNATVDSTSIWRDATACAGSKPRSRRSVKEHKVCKQPRLDLPDGESIDVSASANVQKVVPLSVASASQGTKLISVGSGSRNIFQVVLEAKVEHLKTASHASSVSSNYQLATGQGSIIQTTAGKPAAWVTPSTVRHLEPTKIKNLLGYRPPSAMIVRPAPCVTTSGVTTSCTTTGVQNASQTSRLGMVSPICSVQSQVKELLGNKISVSQVDVSSRQPHSNTSWGHGEYLGSMLVSLGQTGSNLTNVGRIQQLEVLNGVSSIGNQQMFESTQNYMPEFKGQGSDEVQRHSEAKPLIMSKTQRAGETVTTSHERQEQVKVQQLSDDLAGMSRIRGGDHVGPTQIGITAVSAKPRTLVGKNRDFQNQSCSTSVVHGSERADSRIDQHLQSFAVGEDKQRLPLIVSAGNVRLTSDSKQQSYYSVAGCQRPRMFPATSAQANLSQMRLNSPSISEVSCVQQSSCRLTRHQGGNGKLRKSSRQIVQEVVEGVLHKFSSSAGFAQHEFQQEHDKVNYSTSQMGVQQEHRESYLSKNSDLNSCEETQENSPNSAVSSLPGDTVASLDMSAVSGCRNMGNARKLESNIFAPICLGSADARNHGNSSAMVNTLSYGPLQQQTGKGCGLQAQRRRSNSRSYFYEGRVDLDNPRVVSSSREGAALVPPQVQPPDQSVSESLGHLPSQEVTLTTPRGRNLKANNASRSNKRTKPLEQFGQSAKNGTGDNSKIMLSRSKVNLTGGGKTKVWYEEYENELLDLSRVLDLMKRLDNGPCVRGTDSSTSSLLGTVQKSKQPFSNQTNKPPMLDAFRHSAQHHSIVASQKKSDCETKMDNFQKQILFLGLKFENPSVALSKKKLNACNKSSDGMRIYIQDKSCLELPSAFLRCRECKSAYNSTSKLSQVLCRFHAFRRLKRNAKGFVVSGGFLSPTDADIIDLSLWMPMLPIVDPQIDVAMAKYIIKNVGNRFCELVEQEKEAMSWVSSNSEIAWKQAVNGIREMCDVCSTTLFNIHWVCRKCGYVACLDCYRAMTRRCSRCCGNIGNCKACSVELVKWARCSIDRQPHEPREMMVTQIIPSDVLWYIGRAIHDIRKKWNIFENCPCGEDRDVNLLDDSSSLEQVNHVTQSDEPVSFTDDQPLSSGLEPSTPDDEPITDGSCDTCCDVGVIGLAAQNQPVDSSCDKTVECESVTNQSLPQLRDFLLQNNCEFDGTKDDDLSATNCRSLNDVLRRVVNGRPSKPAPKVSNLKLSSGSQSTTASGVSPGPGNLDLPSAGNVPHVWLDSGRLLQLLEPRHPGNLKMFQEVWQKGKPVMISNCDKHITKELWLPEAFAKEFGDMENDLVDCTHKVVLIGHKMRRFWQGFEKVSARLKDSHNEPMILKLKDWPPMEDFSEVLPTRFEDLLQGLPLPEYTHRTGVFNIASRLPEYFVRPDLGPKMYNAYGSALHPMVGSTNLHLDISDAVNLILYVGIPTDDTEDHEAAAIEGMRTAGCCEPTMARTTEEGHKPGALWHIFDAKDSDKIRDLLTKVGLETGEPVEPNHDPIHDQSWYLDEALRERLLREYSVQGYTLVQCVGDAIFIPAGAPHQVRNFHSCIKAAEDFVSPENLSHCFQLTQEFRHLSDAHSNHEDKLQVKNIIYHAVKDAIAVLQNTEPDSI